MRTVLALALALATLSVAASLAAAAPAVPVVADVRATGGLCVRGSICATRTLLYADGRVVRDGAVVRRVPAERLRAIRVAIARLDVADVRRHPFTGTCPIAYDGQELVYRLRGVTPVLRSCTWDLDRVPALRLVRSAVGLG